jgi:hypothetical protein
MIWSVQQRVVQHSCGSTLWLEGTWAPARMNAVDEHEIDAGFKELEVHAEARRKEEQAEAEAKRRSKPVLKSTPSMKAGSAYTTKSGAVNSAWGGKGTPNHARPDAWPGGPLAARECDPDSAGA